MPNATILGIVSYQEKPIRNASVTSPTTAVACLNGGWITQVIRPGTYVFTASADGFESRTIRLKVTAAALRGGKAIRAPITVRPAKQTAPAGPRSLSARTR